MSATAIMTEPPGPKASLLDTLVYRPRRDPLQFFWNVKRTYGDLAAVRLGGERIYVVSDPQAIKDILVTHNRNFTKSRGLERAKRLLGNGLLTSEGAFHLRQRRLMQPAFHRDRIANYAAAMVEYARGMRDGWTPGATLDIAREMNRLTLSIVGKTLFDVDVEHQAAEVGEALSEVLGNFWTMLLPFSDVIERLPIPRLRRGRLARGRLDAVIYRMIADRRASGRDRGDLLSMLLVAQDEDDGGVMTDQQVRDEAMTIFLAGHETTANAELTWTWYLTQPVRDPAQSRKQRCTRRSTACCTGGCRRSTDARISPRCPTSSASSPSRCACIRPRGSSAAVRSPTIRSARSSRRPVRS